MRDNAIKITHKQTRREDVPLALILNYYDATTQLTLFND